MAQKLSIIAFLGVLFLLYGLLYKQGAYILWETIVDAQQENSSLEAEYLLTMFTTFKELPEREYIQTNTVQNWGSLGDNVQPLLYTDSSPFNSSLVNASLQHDWLINPVLHRNIHGTPFLKDMYHKASSLVRSKFYGYCNGDILFDEGLVDTLAGINRTFPDDKPLMVIGRRTNVQMNITAQIPIHEPKAIQELAKKKGRLFRPDAEDYFFIWQPHLFPWHSIKDVVIGRPAYDNYFVAQAIRGKVTVVDATRTVLAFHQTGKDGNFAGAQNKDGGFNRHLIGRYNYNLGLTASAQYYTVRESSNTIKMIKR